jgi:hypothetical protein
LIIAGSHPAMEAHVMFEISKPIQQVSVAWSRIRIKDQGSVRESDNSSLRPITALDGMMIDANRFGGEL